jgi:hypothetical protein
MLMKVKPNQKGQALIELIIFLPLMFTVYALISGFANAINGSINQQKVTRSYFYFRVQNNSTVPKPDPEKTYSRFQQFGMYYLGWKEFFVDDNPMAPCYKVSIPLRGRSSDTCDEEYTEQDSLFMRVATVYGVCGATYSYRGSDETLFLIPDVAGAGFGAIVAPSGCLVQR